MKGRSLFGAGALALSVALALSGVACSSDEPSPGAPIQDASAPEVYDVCKAYTKVGDPCPVASGRLCFPVCRTGGCRCTATPTGSVWTCKADLSCFPDSSPLVDGSEPEPPAEDDGGADVATADANGDAGVNDSSVNDSGDASVNDGSVNDGSVNDAADAG